MEKHVLHISFRVLLVLVLVLKCGTVPVRPRRQVQDHPLVHEDLDHDDYDADNSDNPIVDDDTSQLSPHDETRSDHLQGNIDYADHLDTNRSWISNQDGISSDIGADGVIRDLDLEHEHDQGHLEPVIGQDGHLNENHPHRYVTGHLNVQGESHLPSSRRSDHNLSSVSQGHADVIGTTTGTTGGEHLVINAVGRAVNVNVSTSEGRQNHHGFLMGQNVNVSTSEERQTHHGFLMGQTVNVSTSEERQSHNGFLMGNNIQNVDNEHNGLNTNALTSRSSSAMQATVTTTTTTTPEPFITVRLPNISSHEWTESTAQDHIHNNDIIIDRTDQNSGGRSNHDPDTVDRPEEPGVDGRNITTEIPFTGEGQVATLPGDPNVEGKGHETDEHLSGHEETEGHEHGIDVPIDNGEHPQNGNNEEHNEPGPPRHTNNPVVGTTNQSENIPVTEPVLTTPNLIILPTPANLEPEERSNSAIIHQEPQSSVIFQGGENEHTEPSLEGQGHLGVTGESGIHENSGHGNHTEERQFTAGEGHIEFITELPGIQGEHEIKPNKNLPKLSEEKFSTTPSLVSPSSLVFESFTSENLRFVPESRQTATEEYLPISSTMDLSFSSLSVSEIPSSNLDVHTVVPESVQSSTLDSIVDNLEITSTKPINPCSQSDYQLCVTVSPSSSVPDDFLFSSHSVIPVEYSAMWEISTPTLPDTASVGLLETSTTDEQQVLTSSAILFPTTTAGPQHSASSSNTLFPTKTASVEQSVSSSSGGKFSTETAGPQQSFSSLSGDKFSTETAVPQQSASSLSGGKFSTETAGLQQSISFTSSSLSTRTADKNISDILESSVFTTAKTRVPILPTQTTDQLRQTSKPILSTDVSNESRSVASLMTSQISATPVSSEVVYSSTEYFLLTSSPSVAPLLSTQELSSRSTTSVPMVTQTTPSSVTFPMLTSNPTTKKKENHSSTTLASTPLTTRKKPDTDKEPEKPENQSSNAIPSSTSSSTISSASTTTTSQIITTTLPSTSQMTTTQKIEISTPPSVYIEIELRMDWSQFCISKQQFISEIKDIILSEKGYTVDEERFILSTEDCRSANNLLLDEEHIKIITIKMYIVDIDGKLDILLTTVTSSVISKGFQQSNYLKDKIVSVHTVNRKQPETLPESKSERRRDAPSVTMVIVLASMGGFCCVALVILQVLIHRRVKAKKKQRQFIGHRASLQSMDHVALGVIPKSRPNSGYWNPALDDTMELPEPEEHSHILNFSGLANFCMDTKAIYAEFQTIPFDNVDLTSVPVGEEDKNRFANVLPHKHSRVSLKKTQDNKSEYINASYINGYMGEKRVYIATQSPLVNTVDDFWRMIWEQQTRTILMLNPVTQQGKPKQSTCYWPDNLETDCRREFEDYIVTLKKRDVQQDYIDCTLEIMDIERNLKREIHHFWFTCWSDTGPPEPLTFVKFVLDTRPHYENSGSPVVLHCGPGTGRTGAFIAVDICMRMFEDRRRVDIQSCVHKMRAERAGAVQTKEQYNIVYQALNEYAVILSSPSISTRSSVITLHAML